MTEARRCASFVFGAVTCLIASASPPCSLRLESPRAWDAFAFEDDIPLTTRLHLANASLARRLGESEAELRVELDAPAVS